MEYGKINSIQTLGTLDGPGVRFVVFLQGCPLRCGYCHNPETQDLLGGTSFSSDEIINKAIRYREYFGTNGGITLSGGEPLLQPDFCAEIFEKAHQNGINTCLDTSGCIINEAVERLIDLTDYVMLDIKFTNEQDYKEYVGCSMSVPLEFLQMLQRKGKTVRLRQVIVPTLNDNEENILRLSQIANEFSCVEKIELLPFKKLCKSKYDALNREFLFEKFETPTKQEIAVLQEKLNNSIK